MSVSSNVDNPVKGASVTVPAGTYVIIAYCGFSSSNTEAIRRTYIFANDKSLVSQSLLSKYWTAIQASYIYTATDTVTLYAAPSAGIELTNISTSIEAIRIK